MQILGIYLIDGEPGVIKNLKTEEEHGIDKCWYPFGNFEKTENCHKLFVNFDETEYKEYEIFKAKINKQQEFNRFLYKLEGEKQPSININCIVGKNGSGKSSLLTLEYRIINNLACKIQQYLKNYNQDFKPVWATGFDAELYYLIDKSLYQIKIEDNKNWRIINKEENYVGSISLTKISEIKNENGKKFLKKENILDTLFNSMDKIKDTSSDEYKSEEKKLLNILKRDFFYTVGTNYSLYSNSTISDDWGAKEELWMNTIFHKNDGYFTPIVLVPYKYDNCATIDTRKELNLAKERVTTLALLVYAQTGNNFVENFIPSRINYELRKSEEKDKDGKEIGYVQKTFEKLCRTIDEYYENLEKTNPLDIFDNTVTNNISAKNDLNNAIKKLWTEKLFTQTDIENYLKDLKNAGDIFKTIKENTLEYLSYKTIKICLYYDEYKNEFHEYPDKDILIAYKDNPDNCIRIIKKIINKLFSKEFPLNFTNLKIKQCTTFLENLDFYIAKNKNEILINKGNKDSEDKSFINLLKDKIQNENLSYDNVFINLLPPYFNKELIYEGDKTLASLSSGESQLMNSLSYAVYHIKNATSSNKIGYQYVNLVFDEAELYYHPEYQRTFIQKLLGVIERSKFSRVESINITIVTHSPFIISDIPHTNLLCLKDGERNEKVISKTLGANFYDLMQNQFFMESSIGAVVEKIVNSIIDDFNIVSNDKFSEELKNKTKKKYEKVSNETINFYEDFVNKLSDQYLRMTLKNMIGIIREETFIDRRINELNEKISALEGKNNA